MRWNVHEANKHPQALKELSTEANGLVEALRVGIVPIFETTSNNLPRYVGGGYITEMNGNCILTTATHVIAQDDFGNTNEVNYRVGLSTISRSGNLIAISGVPIYYANCHLTAAMFDLSYVELTRAFVEQSKWDGIYQRQFSNSKDPPKVRDLIIAIGWPESKMRTHRYRKEFPAAIYSIIGQIRRIDGAHFFFSYGGKTINAEHGLLEDSPNLPGFSGAPIFKFTEDPVVPPQYIGHVIERHLVRDQTLIKAVLCPNLLQSTHPDIPAGKNEV